MIKVYTANTPNGLKIPFALEELGVDYQLVLMNLSEQDQKSREFLEINPNGRIPAIADYSAPNQEGMPQTVFESGAILLYLAEKYGKLLGRSGADRLAAIEWLFFQIGGVGPMFGQIGYFRGSDKFPSKNAVARFLEESQRLVSVLDHRLQQQTWLAGEHFTIADVANFGWLNYAETAGIELSSAPAVRAWLRAINSRTALKHTRFRFENPDDHFRSGEVLLGVQG